ncbi:MAG TPA: hypothetical protein VI874_02665 [Candidatus Norongarragalinales archaeon]|nr:hypothetical protein [Candidatus Norongarragalinales archaeon]
MKQSLSHGLVLLGVALIALGIYNANQYWVQQATIAPSLAQLENAGTGLQGFDLDQTRQLITASTNALLQMFLTDLILGLLLLSAGIYISPQERHAH